MSSCLVILTLSFFMAVQGFRESLQAKEAGVIVKLHQVANRTDVTHGSGSNALKGHTPCDDLHEKDQRRVARDQAKKSFENSMKRLRPQHESLLREEAAIKAQAEADKEAARKEYEAAKKKYDDAVALANNLQNTATQKSDEANEVAANMAIARTAFQRIQDNCDQGAKSTKKKLAAAHQKQQQKQDEEQKLAAETDGATALCQTQCTGRNYENECKQSFRAIQSQCRLGSNSTKERPQFRSVVCAFQAQRGPLAGDFIAVMINFELLANKEKCTDGHKAHKKSQVSCEPGLKNSKKPAGGRREIPKLNGYEGSCQNKGGYCALQVVKSGGGKHEATLYEVVKKGKKKVRATAQTDELLFVSDATAQLL